MKAVRVEFKFEIGDIVTSILDSNERKYLVAERMFQECPGGAQKIYRVRNFSAMVTDGYLQVNEIEMKIWEDKK